MAIAPHLSMQMLWFYSAYRRAGAKVMSQGFTLSMYELTKNRDLPPMEYFGSLDGAGAGIDLHYEYGELGAASLSDGAMLPTVEILMPPDYGASEGAGEVNGRHFRDTPDDAPAPAKNSWFHAPAHAAPAAPGEVDPPTEHGGGNIKPPIDRPPHDGSAEFPDWDESHELPQESGDTSDAPNVIEMDLRLSTNGAAAVGEVVLSAADWKGLPDSGREPGYRSPQEVRDQWAQWQAKRGHALQETGHVFIEIVGPDNGPSILELDLRVAGPDVETAAFWAGRAQQYEQALDRANGKEIRDSKVIQSLEANLNMAHAKQAEATEGRNLAIDDLSKQPETVNDGGIEFNTMPRESQIQDLLTALRKWAEADRQHRTRAPQATQLSERQSID